MKIDFDAMTRNFILGESKSSATILSYAQSLGEIINRLNPRTIREKRDLEIAREHLSSIQKQGRRLMEQIQMLEEKLNVLEEEKSNV